MTDYPYRGDIYIHECLKCGHIWSSKEKRPYLCPSPKCHSPRWDVL